MGVQRVNPMPWNVGRLTWLLSGLLALSGCLAAEPLPNAPAAQPGTRMLFDFDDLAPAGLEAQELDAELVEHAGGQALAITSHLGPSWPGVTLSLLDAPVDLSAYDKLEMDVWNLDDHDVRVLLQVNDAQADGNTHHSVTATVIPAGGRGTAVADFGMWHGQTRLFDPDRAVSVRILLDRPSRPHRFIVDNIRAVSNAGKREAAMQSPWFQRLENPLGRGVNMGNMLEAPTEGEWGVRLDEGYFATIAEAGFDNVRVPVRWSNHAADEPPYTIDPRFMARVERAVDAALAQGLKVVLNIHHYEEIMREPEAHRERFLALWRQIAEHFADQPGELWFELLNEPNQNMGAGTWNTLANAAIAVIRESNPERMIVVGGANWNSVDSLAQLELPEDDRNLVGTFHYYNPFQFTHQGAGWTGAQADEWLGTTWDGTEAEREAVARDLDKALVWSVEHQRPVYLGEFGAYSRADMASRARWTRFVAEEALKRKLGFAYWEFAAGFGAWDPGTGQWREPLRAALVD